MIQGILHLKIDPNQKYQQQCITITFLHLTQFWGNSSRLCTLDGLTLQDMAHTFRFVMALVGCSLILMLSQGHRNSTSFPILPKNQVSVWAQRTPGANKCEAVASTGGILHKARWAQATHATRGSAWGSLSRHPSDRDAAPRASDHCGWPQDQERPLQWTMSSTLPSHTKHALVWGSAVLSFTICWFLCLYCKSNDIVCFVNIAAIAVITGFLDVGFSDEFWNMSI